MEGHNKVMDSDTSDCQQQETVIQVSDKLIEEKSNSDHSNTIVEHPAHYHDVNNQADTVQGDEIKPDIKGTLSNKIRKENVGDKYTNTQTIQHDNPSGGTEMDACLLKASLESSNTVNNHKSISSKQTRCTIQESLDKRQRPRRTVTLKAKSYVHNTETDEDDGKFISKTCTLNCVMCAENFSELLELESHVRSHDEVVHFSLVLKSAGSNKQQKKNNIVECSSESLGKSEHPSSRSKEHRKRGRPKKKGEKSQELAHAEDMIVDENVEGSDQIEFNIGDTQIAEDGADPAYVPTIQEISTNGKQKVRKTRDDRKKQITKLNYVLVKHKSRGRPSHALKCPECDEVIKSKLAMRLHYRIEHRRRGYNTKTTCDVCNDTFASVKILKEHLNEKHDLKLSAHNKIYKCPFCDEFFDRKSPLLKHKKEAHPGQTNYMCDDCGKKCHTPSELNIHRRMHTGEKPYQCDQCKVMFRFANSLKEHMRLHTGEKPFQCDICGATFARQCNKRRHMISHTGKFSHSCEYCGKGFNDVGPLKIHIRMHTGERPFQCDMCEMKFVTKAQMQCHKAKHTQVRSHLCQICGAAFLYSVDLRRHTKIHTGIRNYKCDECNAAFFRLDHLKRHQRSHASNSKRLKNTEWKPRPASKRQVIKTDIQVPDQEQSLATSVLTQEVVGMSNVHTVQHVCIVCSAVFNTDEELQHHMMLHMKQNNMAYVIRDIVQGNTGTAECAPELKDINSQPMYQQIPTEETGNICTMCNVIVVEPGGLKQHLQTVHQLQ